MTISSTPDLKKAQQVASTAQVLAIIALVILAINIVFHLGFPIAGALTGGAKPWRQELNDIGLIAIRLLPALFFFEAINQLRRALKHYAEGEFFAAKAAKRVTIAGDYAVVAMIAVMVVVPNLTLWVSHQGGADIRLESEFIGMLAFALFVSAVGRILTAATELKTENEAFV